MKLAGIAFFASSLPEAFGGFCSVAGSVPDFCRNHPSRVPSKAAIANATPHTRATAALTVFKPLPTRPRRRPQTTDKLTNVTPAVTHFMEPWLVKEKARVLVHCHQIPALCPGTTL